MRQSSRSTLSWTFFATLVAATIIGVGCCTAAKAQDVPWKFDQRLKAVEDKTVDLEKRLQNLEWKFKPQTRGGGDMTMDSTPYAEVRRRVEGGEKVILVAGPVNTRAVPVKLGWTTLRSDDAPLSQGIWDCWKDDSGIWTKAHSRYELPERMGVLPWLPVGAGSPASEVAASRPFGQGREVTWDFTRATSVRTVAPVSTSSPAVTRVGRIDTPVRTVARPGIIRSVAGRGG